VPLVSALRARWPEAEIVLSTVTATGAAVARARLPGAAVFTCPLDLPRPVRRALARVDPRALVVLETELWPNLFRALAGAGRPVAVVNGRISDRSYRRYRRVRALFGRVLRDVALFAMQSAEDARRVIDLGAPADRVTVTGSLKMDGPDADGEAGPAWRERLGLGDRTVWVAGSTHRGEEDAVLAAFRTARARRADLRLVLAPRHPERVEEVEAQARAAGWRVARRSRPAGAGDADVVLLDTVGELGSLYGAADVVFVGGSLVPIGGHNVIEPARHGKAVLFGPHMGNFREAAALLVGAAGAVQVTDAAALGPAVARLLEDAGERARLGAAARAAVRGHQGALRRTVEALGPVLGARLRP
jgi:3-deoxy-D-manno-octulosonic-acid transferase